MNQNLGNRSAFERIVGLPRHLRVDWPNQTWRGVDIVDAIKTGAKETIAAPVELASADVEDRRVRRRHRQCANRQRVGAVKNRDPICAAIKRAPYAALCSSQINLI